MFKMVALAPTVSRSRWFQGPRPRIDLQECIWMAVMNTEALRQNDIAASWDCRASFSPAT